MSDQKGQARLLVAATPGGLRVLRRLLGEHVRLSAAERFDEAAALIGEELDAVLCTLHFAESKMFDLLRLARATKPDIPFICCRVLRTRLRGQTIEGAGLAAKASGAAAYLDLPALHRERGLARGNAMFRDAVLSLCLK